MSDLTHVWRWVTVADPNRPSPASTTRGHARLARRITHPLAARCGQPCRVLARGRNGNRLIEFADGYKVVAPFWAARRQVSA